MKINLRAYWIFAAFVGGGWLLLGLASYWRHVPWPTISALRAERVTKACTIYPFGKSVVLTDRYSEPELRTMAADAMGLAPLIREVGKHTSPQVSPGIMKLAGPPYNKPYDSKYQDSELKKWSLYLQSCARSFDRDYRAVRKHNAALEFSLRARKILLVPMWLVFFGVAFTVVRFFTRR